mmetsp:Transcript_15888/g.43209  ORF Transcript_15888/g.43209 Transcript_15888/m.43209 type:complete len:202 (-) Transcript_15888:154-759(-)
MPNSWLSSRDLCARVHLRCLLKCSARISVTASKARCSLFLTMSTTSLFKPLMAATFPSLPGRFLRASCSASIASKHPLMRLSSFLRSNTLFHNACSSALRRSTRQPGCWLKHSPGLPLPSSRGPAKSSSLSLLLSLLHTPSCAAGASPESAGPMLRPSCRTAEDAAELRERCARVRACLADMCFSMASSCARWLLVPFCTS